MHKDPIIPTVEETLAAELRTISWRLYAILARADLNGEDAHDLHTAWNELGELADALTK